MDGDAKTLPPAEQIKDLLAGGGEDAIGALLEGADPVALAELFFALSTGERETLVGWLPDALTAQLLNHLDPPILEELLAGLGAEFLARVAALMEPDDVADLLAMVPQPHGAEVLRRLVPAHRENVALLLGFPEDSAGGLMDPDVVRVRADLTVAEAVEEIRRYVEKVRLDDFFSIFVVAKDNTLVGTVPNWKMLLARPEQLVSEIMAPGALSVGAHRDQEEISHLMRDHDLVVVPVVDDQKKLIGRITVDDILDVIDEEHEEDLGRITGTGTEEVRELSVAQTIRARAPFLLVALGGELALAVMMRRQESLISAVPALAFFIPLIMAMGGNTGMQSASLVIRGLATGEVRLSHFWHRLGRELLVSLGIGVGIAATVVFGGGLITGRFDLGLSVGLAALTLVLLATTMGVAIPMALKSLHLDPALATGPFITTMNDILGILVYLGIAVWVVR